MDKLAKVLLGDNPGGIDVDCPITGRVLHITSKDWRYHYTPPKGTEPEKRRDGFYCNCCDQVHKLEDSLVGAR